MWNSSRTAPPYGPDANRPAGGWCVTLGLPAPTVHERARAMPAPGMHSGVATDDALNLSMSEHALPLYEAVKAFIENEVEPITAEFYRHGQGRAEHWGYGEGQ